VIPTATAGSGVDVHVGGNTATVQDESDKIAERLPVSMGAVVILSLLFLTAVFRSVWVPLVSAAFNLLSIAAAYGVVVAIFQWQWGSGLLGVDGEVPIHSGVPLLMFAILFGLSMDSGGSAPFTRALRAAGTPGLRSSHASARST
jgi:putative drug exporter of the RND superfamily